MSALPEAQSRASTRADFIDPEQNDVRRSLLSLGWEIVADHSLVLYYLDQNDDSKTLNLGEFENIEQIDEDDAESFGALYQPELSNLEVDVVGLRWQVRDFVEISVLN